MKEIHLHGNTWIKQKTTRGTNPTRSQRGVCLPPECAPCCSLRPCCPVARQCCSCGLVPPDSAGTTAAWPPTTHTHYQA